MGSKPAYSCDRAVGAASPGQRVEVGGLRNQPTPAELVERCSMTACPVTDIFPLNKYFGKKKKRARPTSRWRPAPALAGCAGRRDLGPAGQPQPPRPVGGLADADARAGLRRNTPLRSSRTGLPGRTSRFRCRPCDSHRRAEISRPTCERARTDRRSAPGLGYIQSGLDAAALSRTAAAIPSGPQTTFAQTWMPWLRYV